MSEANRPFEGLKVIDCASFIAAPAAATVLSDFGAQVIKIEPPTGDMYRDLIKAPGMPAGERNFPWELASRNKRSLVLDLKLPQALEVLHRLVTQAEVFITNMPLPVRRRLLVDYKHLGPLNPRLIYASFTAYGETGPEADKTGFDSTAYWARSGLMDQMRADYTAPPVRSVAGLGDHPSAMTLFGAIATALYRRERTGKGGRVSASLMGNGLWANSFLVQAKLNGSDVPPRQPREKALNPLTNSYCCRDNRWIILTLLNEARQFAPLFDALDCAHLAVDPRFATAPARRENAAALVALLDQQFALRDLAQWRTVLDGAGITFGLIGTLDDIPGDQQMQQIGAIVPFADGSGMTVSSPFEMDGVTKLAPGPAPAIGQHSEQVLRDAGYSDQEIAKLRALKVLG